MLRPSRLDYALLAITAVIILAMIPLAWWRWSRYGIVPASTNVYRSSSR